MTSYVKKEADNSDILRLLCNEQWSNAACCGYLIKACETLDYSREQINALLIAMKAAFEQFSTDKAKDVYIRY